MKITALEVDGFGVWSGLKLDGLSEGLNVFLGPNEAGKTTLMQFVRSVLYGFTTERRHYLPPLRGGRPGGSVHVGGPNGSFQVCRHRDPESADDEIILAASDGTRQGAHLLKVLLCNIDEAIFNNVFAIGLRELQELGTLNDTEAASLLYSLSAGLDRVALVDVVKELEVSRSRLLSADGSPGQVTGLIAKREKLRAELEEFEELTHRYLRLAGERSQLERETTRLEEEANGLQHQARVIEIAANLGDRWERRRELDEQLAALGPVETLPDGALDRLDSAEEGLERCGQQMTQLRHDWDEIRAEAADLNVNQALWRLAPRIEVLAEQESWIATLQSRTAELETEITDLEAQLSAEKERFGLTGGTGNETLPSISASSLRALRLPARELRQCRGRLQEAQQEIDTARNTSESLAAQIETALSARGERNLAEAIDRTGSLVGQLRRLGQIDERLDQMDRYQVDLEEQSRDLLQRQVLPVGVLMGLGGVFMVSVMMILAGLAGLLLSESITGPLGWPLALLGLAGFSATVATKYVLERSNARRLEGCQKQIGMLRLQINEARQERDSLTQRLSIDDTPVAGRLKAAEGTLAKLEELVPLDANRKAAEQEAEAAGERARQAQGELDAALRRWREALLAVGMPSKLSPKQVRSLATRCDFVRELHHRLESRYEEYEGRRRELEALTGRIAQLAADADLTVEGDDPIEQVRLLARDLGEHEARLKRRDVLRGQARQIRRKRAKLHAAVRRLRYRRQELLRQVGADDEHEFRQRAAEIARAEGLRRERASLAREIDAAVAGHGPED
ncbi:MAG: AAA family ATPase, partial [Planctomycetota bacterium]